MNIKLLIFYLIFSHNFSRFSSFYHFIRFGNKEGDGADVPMDETRKNRSLEDCILQNVNECKNPVWQLVPYLCGQDPFCRNRTDQVSRILCYRRLERAWFAIHFDSLLIRNRFNRIIRKSESWFAYLCLWFFLFWFVGESCFVANQNQIEWKWIKINYKSKWMKIRTKLNKSMICDWIRESNESIRSEYCYKK